MTKQISKGHASEILKKQILRSSISVALNYSESKEAESVKDLIHKWKIALKELRETHTNLRIIEKLELCDSVMSRPLLKETDELIRIFVSSVKKLRSRIP